MRKVKLVINCDWLIEDSSLHQYPIHLFIFIAET